MLSGFLLCYNAKTEINFSLPFYTDIDINKEIGTNDFDGFVTSSMVPVDKGRFAFFRSWTKVHILFSFGNSEKGTVNIVRCEVLVNVSFLF